MSEYKSLCERLNKDITRLRAALAAAAAALRAAAAELAAVTAERDRLQILHDEAYIAGMKHGWNCCAEGDEARYTKSIENTREQIRLARAALEGVMEPSAGENNGK